MINERIYFDENDNRVYLDVYAVNDEKLPSRDAILIIPGGAYIDVSWREGIYTALAFLGRGVNAFVLNYSVGEHAIYPRQLLDAARALKYIKDNVGKYHVNPNRIFALGYSAGGHLLGTLATLYHKAETMLDLPEDYLKIRGAIFCYPVITAYGATHELSFKCLMKKPLSDYTEAEKELLSIEKNITPDSPPAFIWHTAGDKYVPINGSLKLCEAYYNAGVTVELHVYPYGTHGIALATEQTSNGIEDYIQPRAEAWLGEAYKWMQGLDK